MGFLCGPRSPCWKVPANMGCQVNLFCRLHHRKWILHSVWPVALGQRHYDVPGLLVSHQIFRGNRLTNQYPTLSYPVNTPESAITQVCYF